jgi:cyclic pyranopterin phosphate synthase
LDTVLVTFEFIEGAIEARCRVKAQARTGVEMEALVGVSMALNTLWDMVKYLEKDAAGQYPQTRIDGIRVVKKEKRG